jgi:type I restriction enzyme S subunit
MSIRAKIPLSDFITLQRGFDLPTARRKEGDAPVIASTGIAGYHNEAKVQGPGVVIGRSGSIGGGQYTADDFWPLNTTLWVKDFKGNNPRFTYYLLKGIDFTRFNAGAGVPTLNRNHIASLRVSSFSPAEQDRVASILSAYDDLIENNRRRIQLLEESARLLYREWFVSLRFPGHEHVKIIDGVPEGWKKGSVGDLVNVQSGYAFKSKEWQIEGSPVIKIKNIENNTIDLDNCQCISQSVADKAQKFLLSGGDFLIAMTGATVGKVGIMPRTKKNYYLNQRVGIMRPIIQPKPIPFLFSFFNTENAQNQILNFAAGSAQPNISPTQIESMKFLLPKEFLLKTYMEICYPLFSQRLILMEQNGRLKQARDLLLPRLMNGEIKV